MADGTHIEVLKQGVEIWNKWRKENHGIQPDFHSVDFHDLQLPSVKNDGRWYHQAEERIDLREADFHDAILSDTNLEKARLDRANLTNAKLPFARLRGVNLVKANLTKVNLMGANVRRVLLTEAIIDEADLTAADFSYGILRQASLKESLLKRATFVGADLSGANFKGASFDATVFGDTMLVGAVELETIDHYGPSILDPQTVVRSAGVPQDFLRGCGWPERLIAHLPTMLEQDIPYYSCFISYSHADKPFARRLHDQLQDRGVRCWLDKHKILPGDDIHEEVQRGIKQSDKVLLCCSESSLNSWWVDNEIETAFVKERELMKERGARVLLLIPLDLDGYLRSNKWHSGKKEQVKSRYAPDFMGWERDNKKFEEQFEKVVKALRVDDDGKGPTPKL